MQSIQRDLTEGDPGNRVCAALSGPPCNGVELSWERANPCEGKKSAKDAVDGGVQARIIGSTLPTSPTLSFPSCHHSSFIIHQGGLFFPIVMSCTMYLRRDSRVVVPHAWVFCGAAVKPSYPRSDRQTDRQTGPLLSHAGLLAAAAIAYRSW
jgi:hypothetical protein